MKRHNVRWGHFLVVWAAITAAYLSVGILSFGKDAAEVLDWLLWSTALFSMFVVVPAVLAWKIVGGNARTVLLVGSTVVLVLGMLNGVLQYPGQASISFDDEVRSAGIDKECWYTRNVYEATRWEFFDSCLRTSYRDVWDLGTVERQKAIAIGDSHVTIALAACDEQTETQLPTGAGSPYDTRECEGQLYIQRSSRTQRAIRAGQDIAKAASIAFIPPFRPH